jgi:nicotinate phosphoribosyltransferase
LKFKDDELQYLRSLRFIKSDFVDYLELFQLKRRFIQASIDEEGRLDIRIEGPMVQAMMFEIFVLAIVNECIFAVSVLMKFWLKVNAVYKPNCVLKQYVKATADDPPFLVSDFGTRRRYSFEWQKCG